MSELLLRTALQNRLSTIGGDIDTVYENEPYRPLPGKAHQIVTLIPSEPTDLEMGNVRVLLQGLFHVLLCFPTSNGVGEATNRAQLIRAAFKRSLSFVSGAVTVTISNTPQVSVGRVGATHYELPVHIRYHAHVLI